MTFYNSGESHGPANIYGFAGVVFEWGRAWERQARPYIAPLQFDYANHTVCSWNDSRPLYPEGGNTGGTPPMLQLPGVVYSAAVNKAYEALIGSIGSQSQWANNLLEANEAIGMIGSRCLQLGKFASALGKGRFGDAAKVLGMSKAPKGVSHAKSFGNNWLEYHFGWEPAVQDVGAAVDTMQKADFGSRVVRGRGAGSQSYDVTVNGDNSTYERDFWKVDTTCKCQATVKISNPNAFLANQLGFVNPLAVAWEAVPYSFVVDWFANVGQCLSAMTDFVGLDVVHAFYTTSGKGTVGTQQNNWGVPVHPEGDHRWTYTQTDSFFEVHRAPRLLLPIPALKPFKGFSVVRGATAVALLLQKMH